MTDKQSTHDGYDRRRFLASVTALGTAGLAGCTDLLSNEESTAGIGQIGSGRAGRDQPGGTPMEDLPALSGELTVYSGRSKFLVDRLVTHIEGLYEEFDLTVRYNPSTDHVNSIINEGEGTPADVFYSVNAGALGALVDEGRTQSIPDTVLEPVREEFHTDDWVGTSGRARTVAYNTDAYAAEEIPADIMAYPDFEGDLGWAPVYGSCQAFVTAMRILEGEEATSEWVEGVVENGILPYPDEAAACQAVANGEIDAAFANHYYIQRILDSEDGQPIATAFTNGDAGSVFNVAGATIVDGAEDTELAGNFIRHLLSAEAQEYFAVETFEYPLISGVDPVGDLPSIDELAVPDIDLARLSDLEQTVDLMRDAGAEL